MFDNDGATQKTTSAAPGMAMPTPLNGPAPVNPISSPSMPSMPSMSPMMPSMAMPPKPAVATAPLVGTPSLPSMPSAPSPSPLSAPSSAPSSAPISAPSSLSTSDLNAIKNEALSSLTPILGKLDQKPEEKFRTTMMLIQSSDNQSLIKTAYEAAKGITDDKARAQALLDIVNEINYFTAPKDEE